MIYSGQGFRLTLSSRISIFASSYWYLFCLRMNSTRCCCYCSFLLLAIFDCLFHRCLGKIRTRGAQALDYAKYLLIYTRCLYIISVTLPLGLVIFAHAPLPVPCEDCCPSPQKLHMGLFNIYKHFGSCAFFRLGD